MYQDPDLLPPPVSSAETGTAVKLVYLLYIAGILSVGTFWIIGLVIAYVCYRDGAAWTDSHYRFQIRTFWIGLAASAVAVPLCLVLVGFVLLGITWLWILVRSIKGLLYALDGQPYPTPLSLGFT